MRHLRHVEPAQQKSTPKTTQKKQEAGLKDLPLSLLIGWFLILRIREGLFPATQEQSAQTQQRNRDRLRYNRVVSRINRCRKIVVRVEINRTGVV